MDVLGGARHILGKALRLESKIAGRVDRAAKDLVASGDRALLEPLETVYAILDVVEKEIQPGGRGTRVFPFNQIALTVLAPSREARGRFEALLSEAPSLDERIAERLRAAACRAQPLAVTIDYADRPQGDWRTPEFQVAFARVAADDATNTGSDSACVEPARIEVAVLKGAAEQPTYSLAHWRIDLGRGAEVRDVRNWLIRTNLVAFTEGGDGADQSVNQSVSRQHAHISCDGRTGHFRLHDDNSGHGTRVVRGGRTIPVPWGPRGVRLQPGDEIVLGDARLRVKF